jgi:hypothetical protein
MILCPVLVTCSARWPHCAMNGSHPTTQIIDGWAGRYGANSLPPGLEIWLKWFPGEGLRGGSSLSIGWLQRLVRFRGRWVFPQGHRSVGDQSETIVGGRTWVSAATPEPFILSSLESQRNWSGSGASHL